MTASEAAQYLRVSTGALAQQRYRRLGPPYVRLGPKTIRYRLEDLERWIGSSVVESSGR